MATKPETNFRKKVRADLQRLVDKGLSLFFEPIQQKAIKGSPDFFMCVRGHLVALELKSEKGIISLIQDAKLQAIGRAGGSAYVVSPSGWTEVLMAITHTLEEENAGNQTH